MASYEIVVKNETAEQNKNPIAGSDVQSESTMAAGGGMTATDVAKGYGIVKKFVQPFVSQLVTAQTSTVSLRTGAEELQDRLQFAQSMIQTGVGLVESIVVGAMVGGFGGAAVGAVMSIATTAVSYTIKAREIELQRSEEAVSLQQVAYRAGGSLSTFSGSRGSNQ